MCVLVWDEEAEELSRPFEFSYIYKHFQTYPNSNLITVK